MFGFHRGSSNTPREGKYTRWTTKGRTNLFMAKFVAGGVSFLVACLLYHFQILTVTSLRTLGYSLMGMLTVGYFLLWIYRFVFEK